MVIFLLKRLLRNTPLTPSFYFTLLFLGLSSMAQAQGTCPVFNAWSSVQVVVPATNTSGTFSITYSGASNPANSTLTVTLFECAGPAVTPIHRGSISTPSGSFSITGKTPGDYYFYVMDCVYPYQSAPTCYKTAVKNVLVTLPFNLSTAGETYEYDALGRINNVKVEGVAKTTYEYDKAGNRKSVVEP